MVTKKLLKDSANDKALKTRGVPAPKKKAVAGSSLRIVGMGGSAGGLEAFEQFFSHIPADTGAAFVLVPHLDPTHKGIMPEIIQRYTAMKVVQADDGMQIKPNSVYVIPPNADLSIQQGLLLLMKPSAPRGLRMSIDFFFRQLAADRKDQAIGIVLSGMGSDGTQGIRAIKEHSGLIMVQDPVQAKYDGMPRSAIATGLVDYVGPVEELPAKLMQYLIYAPEAPKRSSPAEDEPTTSLAKVFALLRTHTGNDFSCYKKATIYRRIERRMNVHQFDKLTRYVRFLQETPAEIDLLYKELLIGVTNFFRDPAMFDFFKEKAFPQLLKTRPPGGPLRVWMPACSTGEETYSLAIVLREALLRQNREKDIAQIQIFATDIDGNAIEKARRGIFAASIAADVSPERLEQFFLREEDSYRVKKDIRDSIVFAPQNVLVDPPFTKLDILCCRNLLIYLDAEMQQKLLFLFHYALNPGGLLILGSAESLGEAGHLFTSLDKKSKLFQRLEVERDPEISVPRPYLREAGHLPAPKINPEPLAGAPYPAQRAILDAYAPPAAVINSQGDILYLNGRTGKFLEPASGKVNVNIFAMAREGLCERLGPAINSALKTKSIVTIAGLRVKSNGSYTLMDLTVQPLFEPRDLRGAVLLVFEEIPETGGKGGRTPPPIVSHAPPSDIHEELKRTRQQLQSTIEEMEATQEELRSANEELQSNNEELQSTNEELTTAKEELQSLNEEMQTVNAELQTKIELLSQSNNDMKNLLNGIDIATIFLDNDFCIKRFTPQAVKIVNLIPGDVGRPFANLVSNLKYDRILDDAKEVLDSLVPKETQVLSIDDRWYNMRLLPYRTDDNVIDGVVITLVDITAMKRMEELLRRRQDELQAARVHADSILSAVHMPLLVLDGKLHVVSASRLFYETFRTSPQSTVGQLIFDLDRGQWDVPELRQLLKDIAQHGKDAENRRIERVFPSAGQRSFLLGAQRVDGSEHCTSIILLTMEISEGSPRPDKTPQNEP